MTKHKLEFISKGDYMNKYIRWTVFPILAIAFIINAKVLIPLIIGTVAFTILLTTVIWCYFE